MIEIKLEEYKSSQQIPDINFDINSLSIEEIELLDIEIELLNFLKLVRIYQNLEESYIFLLQKQYEAEMAASAITSNIWIVDEAILIK